MKKLFYITLFFLIALMSYGQKHTRVPDWKYSIENFGATVASSDNQTAIQAAINKAHANGGGTVYFPKRSGVWKTSQLQCYSDVKLLGDGIGDTLQSASADTLLSFQNQSFAQAEGAYIDGLTLFGNNTGKVGISAQLLYHFAFKNIKFKKFTTYGLYGKGILIGQFENIVIDTCSTGMLLDSFVSAIEGAVSPNIIVFRGGEIRNCFTYGVVIQHSQGNIDFEGTTFEGNGTIHNRTNSGAILWTNGSSGIGLTCNNCWFEVNKGTIVALKSAAQIMSHTFINCQMINNASASVGIEMNAPSFKTYINLIGCNIQSDSLDLFLNSVSTTTFFTQLEINLLGNSSYGTINTASTWVYIKDISFQGITNLISSTATPTILAKNGAGTGPTLSVSTTWSSNMNATITVTTGSAPAANDTLCIVQYANSWAQAGISPVISPANAAAASLSGTSQVWVAGGGTFFYPHIFTNAVALSPSTTYKWNLVWAGK